MSGGEIWNYSELKQTVTHLLCSPCSEKSLSDMQLIQCFTSLFLCVPYCLGSKPVSCGVRFISLFIFPLIVSPPYFFPSLSDKQSAFLIRLGKHKTSSWLHFRKGHLRCDKIPFCSGPGLVTDNLHLKSLLIAGVTFHTPDDISAMTLIGRLTASGRPKCCYIIANRQIRTFPNDENKDCYFFHNVCANYIYSLFCYEGKLVWGWG